MALHRLVIHFKTPGWHDYRRLIVLICELFGGARVFSGEGFWLENGELKDEAMETAVCYPNHIVGLKTQMEFVCKELFSMIDSPLIQYEIDNEVVTVPRHREMTAEEKLRDMARRSAAPLNWGQTAEWGVAKKIV